jgi:putative ABC transport system substrate-binding protein
VNPKNRESGRLLSDTQEAARGFGLKLQIFNASTPSEIDSVFASLRQQRVDALLVGDPFFSSRRQQIVALAAREAIPAIYSNPEFAEDGGLMSYGNDIADAYSRAASCVGRILKGEKPADLPVDQATRFEFVINMRTAKVLGLDVPGSLSARADEVIE